MSEKLFCLVTSQTRTYYRAVTVCTEFLDKDQNIINTTGSIPDGEVTEIAPSTVTVKHFEQGKLHGKLEVLNLADNHVTFSEEYNHGQLVCVTEHDIPTPHKEPLYQGTILKTTQDMRAFYVEGKQIAQETLSANGTTLELLGNIPDGEVKEFNENGTLKTEAVYQHNKLQGTLQQYREDGQLLCKETYEQGILNGPAEYYSYTSKQTLRTNCSYKKTLLEGDFTITQLDGTILEQACYQKGRLHGPRKTYYPGRKLECEETWREGKLQGQRTLYFPTGGTWYTETYQNGRLEGERTEFFTTGTPHISEFYSDGLLSGTRTVYNEQGEVLTTEEYHWGNLVHNTEKHAL